MLKKEFEIWLADSIPDVILLTLSMHVTNLGYLEDKTLHVTELSDGSTKELD